MINVMRERGNPLWVHPEVQWTKLEALVKGAGLASQQLWGKES